MCGCSRYDRPGYGTSTALPDGTVPTIPTFAADAAAVLDHLGVDDAVVAGWSAGGRVAAALAAGAPELVASLFLIGAPAPDEEVPGSPSSSAGRSR